ncbi:MAG: phosphatase [Methanobrevibacter boviskoreani]|uniref:Ppx/GppA phosphatase family protein n=1 Tax=Methanobrevibacter boviskoreani TaxID=1348249 RepID=UPI0023A7B603|nr:phosphatase [Methanobrevibacter boviskoreani]MCI6930065.1 phosphatase [Methanobrevibacter boviskoreani]
MLYGVIDIGSNTVRMNVYSYNKERFKKIFSEKETLGLIAYVKKNKLPKHAINKLVHLLERMQKDLNVLNITDFTAFTTASIRNVKNSEEIVKYVKDKTGIEIQILPSEDEAELSYIGAQQDYDLKDGVLIDSGGGSTEVIIFEHGDVLEEYSMPIGSLNLFNEYVSQIVPSKDEKIKIEERILKEIKKLNIKYDKEIPCMCGVGGSIRAINNILIDLDLKDKKDSIDVNLLPSLEEDLSYNDRSTYDIILHTKPSRIHTVVPGLLIFKVLTQYFNCKEIHVSKCGVREGFFIENVFKKYQDN